MKIICKHCHQEIIRARPNQEWCSKPACQKARKRANDKTRRNLVQDNTIEPAVIKAMQDKLTQMEEENALLRKLAKHYKAKLIEAQGAMQFARETGDL